MYGDHFVPQFILRSFGNHFDMFDSGKQRIRTRLKSDQGFYVKGLYDSELEHMLADEIEVPFSRAIAEIRRDPYRDITESEQDVLHRYAVLALLRTPYAPGCSIRMNGSRC